MSLSRQTTLATFFLVTMMAGAFAVHAQDADTAGAEAPPAAAAEGGEEGGITLGFGLNINDLFYLRTTWIIFMLFCGAAWMASTIWVNQDAIGVGVPPDKWNAILLVTGSLLFLGAFQAGTKLLWLLLVALGAEVGVYIHVRNQRVPSNFRLFTPRHLKELAASLSQHTGMNLDFGGGDKATLKEDRTSVVLTRKDGKTADALATDKRNKEGSQAIIAAKEVMESAIKARATDVHFEPKGDELQVRFRIDGILHNQSPYSHELGRALISSLKVLADMDIAERRRPQDGTFSATLHDQKYDIRAATGPCNYGETMVLRLLDSGGGIVKGGLTGLGLNDAGLKQLRSVVHSPHGMLITVGPTGSGKTTTLYAALSEIDAYQRNIITIEDPIEYRLDNITQIPVNPQADLTFAGILRSVLRQDPDVIMVGEIRDLETAQIAMQAALTGHFVFTTLHANDSVASITRMLDLGLEPTMIQTAVSAVLAQRLVRVLCQECKEAYTPKPQFLQKLRISPDKVQRLYKEKGCEECQGTGFKGRIGLYELFLMTDAIRDLIVGQPSIQALRTTARKQGLKTLQEDGLQKVIAGTTSITEIIRVTK